MKQPDEHSPPDRDGVNTAWRLRELEEDARRAPVLPARAVRTMSHHTCGSSRPAQH